MSAILFATEYAIRQDKHLLYFVFHLLLMLFHLEVLQVSYSRLHKLLNKPKIRNYHPIHD